MLVQRATAFDRDKKAYETVPPRAAGAPLALSRRSTRVRAMRRACTEPMAVKSPQTTYPPEPSAAIERILVKHLDEVLKVALLRDQGPKKPSLGGSDEDDDATEVHEVAVSPAEAP